MLRLLHKIIVYDINDYMTQRLSIITLILKRGEARSKSTKKGAQDDRKQKRHSSGRCLNTPGPIARGIGRRVRIALRDEPGGAGSDDGRRALSNSIRAGCVGSGLFFTIRRRDPHRRVLTVRGGHPTGYFHRDGHEPAEVPRDEGGGSRHRAFRRIRRIDLPRPLRRRRMGALSTGYGHRSRRDARPSIAGVRYWWTGSRGGAGTSTGGRVRTFRVCETHPPLARMARSDRSGDLRGLHAEPGLSDRGDTSAVGAIPRLHLADRRGFHY